jgi:putative endonuclease
MPFHMYILRSSSTGRFYVGHTEDLRKRWDEHHQGRVPSTRDRGPWDLFYVEEFTTRAAASRRERQVKRMKSHRWIEGLARAPR